MKMSMQILACTISLLFSALAAAEDPSGSASHATDLVRFLDAPGPCGLLRTEGFQAALQEDGWGREEDGGRASEGWNPWGREEERGWIETPAPDDAGPGEPQAPKAWSGRLRIGLALGGFLPFAEKEESFGPAETAGVFFGYPLADAGLRLSCEIRLLQGYVSSTDQAGGFDVETFLFMAKHDVLLHLVSGAKGFGFFGFAGLGGGLEFSTSRRTLDSGKEERDAGTHGALLLDAGIRCRLAIGGSVDLVFRLELNVAPVTNNVPVFLAGEIGLQVGL